MKRVLVLQHCWEAPRGSVGSLLEEYGIPYDVVNVETEALPPDPAAYAAIIAFGGPQHVYEDHKHPYFVPEKAFIRETIAQDIPFLGICLGGQLLAAALGGMVKQHTMTEIGFFDVAFTAEGRQDPLYAGLPNSQKIFHWHEDTFDVPEGAALLATHANAENQAFRYGHHAYGLQYHIELDSELLDLWLHHPEFKQEIINTLGYEAYEQINQERLSYFQTYCDHTRIMFNNFLGIADLLSA